MSEKPIVKNDEEFSWILEGNTESGVELATGQLPGQIASIQQTQTVMQALQNAVMDSHLGVNVGRAMAEVMNNIAQNNPELRDNILNDIEQIVANFDEDEVEYLNDVEEIIQENFDLPTVVVDAVVTNISNDVMPVNPTWHGLVNTNRNFASSIKTLSNQVFNMFPCYAEGLQRNGQDQAEQINVLFNMKLRDNAGNFERQAVNLLQNNFTDERELNAMASWISKNGAVVEKTDVSFRGLTPNNYSAQMVMAVTEDRTFLLVKEDSGVASYSFNEDTGDLIFKVKSGKSIRNGDILKILDMETDENFNFIEGTGISVINTNENKLALIYDGADVAQEGDEFRTRVSNYTLLSEQLRLQISESFGGLGDFSGKRPGVSPVDAQYIYTWEGGRRHYLENPGSRDKLKVLFSGGKVERNMQYGENNVLQDTIVEAPKIEDKTDLQGDLKPVTMPERKNTVNSGRIPHMQLLLKHNGFSKGLTSKDEFCVYKQLSNGDICIVTSGNQKKLPITNQFLITVSSDMNLENGSSNMVALADLENQIQVILNSEQKNKI